jgi:alkylation response protein AidB-like acyl-CoA dehydrogenase
MSIEFALSPEQRDVQLGARTFAGDALTGVADAIAGLPTAEERFDALRPFYEQVVAAGFLRAIVDPRTDSRSPGFVGAALMVEELMAVDVNVPLTLMSSGLAIAPILAGATPEQIERLLAPLRVETGAPLAGFAFSEVDGTPAWDDPDPGLRTLARREGDEWVINGWKQRTSNGYGWHGAGADLYTVACRMDLSRPARETMSILAVPGGAPGIHITGSRDTAGHLAAVSPRIHFDDVRVPVENMIGRPGEGTELITRAFSATAAMVGAMCVGVMRTAFDRTLDFARTETRAGGRPLIEHQATGYLLADIKTRIEAVRSLTWRACVAIERSGGREFELAVSNKVYASETAVQVVWDCMRVVGVEAYAAHLPLARLLQDVIAYPLFDGSHAGVRRSHLHSLLRGEGYDSLASMEIPEAMVAFRSPSSGAVGDALPAPLTRDRSVTTVDDHRGDG